MLRLYSDDLENINKLMSQLSKKTSWTTDKYNYNSFEEFNANNKERELKKLEIKSFEPFISIDLSQHSGELRVHSTEIVHDGIFHSLDKILSQRDIKFITLLEAKPIHLIYLGVFLVVISFIKISPLILLIPFIIFILFQGLVGYIRFTRSSMVKMHPFGDEKTFWTRNKDQVILLILGAIIGSALTVLINYLRLVS